MWTKLFLMLGHIAIQLKHNTICVELGIRRICCFYGLAHNLKNLATRTFL